MAEENTINTEQVNKSLKSLSDGFGSMAGTFIAGKATVADAVNMFPVVGGKLKATAGFLEDNIQMYRNLSKAGGGAAGDITALLNQARGAGLGLKEFQEISTANSEVFAGLGGTVNQGAAAFMQQLEQLRVSDLGKDLRRLGLEYEDMAEAQAFIARMDAMSFRRNEMTEATRNARTAEFAKSLDTLSKLTGKQKDEIQKELDARMREGKVRAYMMGLSDEERQMVEEQLKQADAAGFGDLARDILVNGFPTEETRAQAGIMGNTTASLMNLKTMLDNGVDASNKEDAKRLIAQTQGVALQENLNNRNLAMLSGVTSMGDVAGKSLEGMSEGYMAQISEIKKRQDLLGRQLTAEEVLTVQKEFEAKALKQQKKQTDDPGEGDSPGQQLTKSLIGAQDALIDYQAKITDKAVTDVYDGILNPAAKKFGDFLGNNPYDPASGAGFEKVYNSLIDKINEIKGGPQDMTSVLDKLQQGIAELEKGSSNVTQLNAEMAELRREQDPAKQKEMAKALAQKIQAMGGDNDVINELGLGGLIDGSEINSAYFTVSEAVIFKGLPNNNEGTVGSTGGILGDFGSGTPSMLHGKEAVLNEKQLTNLVNGVYNMGQSMAPKLQGMLNNSAPQMNNLSAMGDKMAASMQTIDFSGMQDSMKQMANEMQGPMKEMASQLKGPLESMAGNMMKQVNLSGKQLQVGKMNPGNLFSGIKL